MQDSLAPESVSYRPPTAAGSFYPSNPDTLKRQVNLFVSSVKDLNVTEDIVALVAPHAGYVYSGSVAGKAYAQVKGKEYNTVVIIGPSHYKSFRGASVFDGDAYVTPLGNAIVDKELAKRIANYSPNIKLSRDGHSWDGSMNEHSIEVQIPFIQVVQPNAKIVPISMGSQDPQTEDELARALYYALKDYDKKVLLVASTDLSHFHNYETAKAIDIPFTKAFGEFDYFKISNELKSSKLEACGGSPVVVVMMAAEQLGATKAIPLEYATSADAPSGYATKDRVVGYFAGAIVKSKSEMLTLLPKISEEEKNILLQIAKISVYNAVLKKRQEYPYLKDYPEYFYQKLPVFVTLTKKGELRGCIGHTTTDLPLVEEIKESARLSATSDYRFGEVKEDELKDLEFEITILSRFKRVLDLNEIKIGRDGLYIRYGGRSGLLLPQVASDRNWSVKEFLENVCYKAGLGKDAYKEKDAMLYRFEAVILH